MAAGDLSANDTCANARHNTVIQTSYWCVSCYEQESGVQAGVENTICSNCIALCHIGHTVVQLGSCHSTSFVCRCRDTRKCCSGDLRGLDASAAATAAAKTATDTTY